MTLVLPVEKQGNSSASVPPGKGQGGTRTKKRICLPCTNQPAGEPKGSVANFVPWPTLLPHLISSSLYSWERLKSSLSSLGSRAVTWPLAFVLASPATCTAHTRKGGSPFYTHPTLLRKRKNDTITLSVPGNKAELHLLPYNAVGIALQLWCILVPAASLLRGLCLLDLWL